MCLGKLVFNVIYIYAFYMPTSIWNIVYEQYCTCIYVQWLQKKNRHMPLISNESKMYQSFVVAWKYYKHLNDTKFHILEPNQLVST